MGSHTDLSGSIAILGVDGANGARMRFQEANEAGGVHGRKIRFIVEDSQYQVPKAIQDFPPDLTYFLIIDTCYQ